MELDAEIIFQVYWLTPEEGGRRTPVFQGYSPQFKHPEYGGSYSLYITSFDNSDQMCFPGETAIATGVFQTKIIQMGKLHTGFTFSLYEASRHIANCTIIEVIRQDYAHWNPSQLLNDFLEQNLQDDSIATIEKLKPFFSNLGDIDSIQKDKHGLPFSLTVVLTVNDNCFSKVKKLYEWVKTHLIYDKFRFKFSNKYNKVSMNKVQLAILNHNTYSLIEIQLNYSKSYLAAQDEFLKTYE